MEFDTSLGNAPKKSQRDGLVFAEVDAAEEETFDVIVSGQLNVAEPANRLFCFIGLSNAPRHAKNT